MGTSGVGTEMPSVPDHRLLRHVETEEQLRHVVSLCSEWEDIWDGKWHGYRGILSLFTWNQTKYNWILHCNSKVFFFFFFAKAGIKHMLVNETDSK